MIAVLTIHQVQNETQFIRGVEGICHTHYERTILQIKKDREGTTNETGMLLCSLSNKYVRVHVRVTHPGADQRQHDSFIERQRFSLLHFDPLFI